MILRFIHNKKLLISVLIEHHVKIKHGVALPHEVGFETK
jgi:hypothetical protein